MGPYAMGEIVAERTVAVVTGDGVRHPVTIRVGRPRPSAPARSGWYCPIQIIGMGDEAVRATFGADSYQALQLSFERLRAELTSSAREEGVQLVWSDDGHWSDT
jgi:hypothetical protein